MGKLKLIALIMISPILAFSFDEQKCGDLFPKSGDNHPPYLSPIYSTTLIPSATSYISSFGQCSMYGQNEMRQKFIATTYQEILIEAASGKGEHIATLGSLSGCSDDVAVDFATGVQNNFARIFANDNPVKVADRVDQFISENPQLRKHCRLIAWSKPSQQTSR